MLRHTLLPSLGILLIAVLPASAQKREIIRLQADVSILQQQLRELQKGFDSDIAVYERPGREALRPVEQDAGRP